MESLVTAKVNAMVAHVLPPNYATAIAAMRPSLMRALTMAVESGDAAGAARLYAVCAGPDAAAHLRPRDALEVVGAWLSRQGEVANDLMAA